MGSKSLSSLVGEPHITTGHLCPSHYTTLPQRAFPQTPKSEKRAKFNFISETEMLTAHMMLGTALFTALWPLFSHPLNKAGTIIILIL